MEALPTKAKHNQIILSNEKQYFYTINPFEVSNALGTSVAILQEYSISGMSGEKYKLYKTKEGNWYDIAEVNSSRYNLILISLKAAIDLKENNPESLF